MVVDCASIVSVPVLLVKPLTFLMRLKCVFFKYVYCQIAFLGIITLQMIWIVEKCDMFCQSHRPEFKHLNEWKDWKIIIVM